MAMSGNLAYHVMATICFSQFFIDIDCFKGEVAFSSRIQFQRFSVYALKYKTEYKITKITKQ